MKVGFESGLIIFFRKAGREGPAPERRKASHGSESQVTAGNGVVLIDASLSLNSLILLL